jgi:hypothetical protein
MKSRVIQDEPDRPGAAQRPGRGTAADPPPARRVPMRTAVLLVLLAVAVLIGGLLLGYALS